MKKKVLNLVYTKIMKPLMEILKNPQSNTLDEMQFIMVE